MSQTFSLVCMDTKQWIWIGQGWGSMTSFYTGEPETMARLQRFLNAHRDKELRFLCDDTTPWMFDDGWQEFEEGAEPRRR